MATFVLVPGAWLGGWAWQPVARRLRRDGHDVHPVTLTGLGERVHLSSVHVDLDTHVTDVANLMEFEDLRDVVLVGHSYGGAVVTGAADRVPDRIAQVVYLDGGPLPGGSAFLDLQPPEAQEHAKRQASELGDGWRLPMPSWEELEEVQGASLEGLGAAERELIRSRAVAQPFGTYTQPLRLGDPARDPLPSVLIACSFPLEQVRQLIDAGHPWFRDLVGPHWRLEELPTGHWPLFSVPEELAQLLDRLAAG